MLLIIDVDRKQTLKQFFTKKNHNTVSSYLRKNLKDDYHQKEHFELLMAYLLGDKTKLDKNILNKHKKLNIYHLFTPSGIHLSSLLFSIYLFFKIMKKKRYYRYIETFISFLIFFLNGFNSLKRIAVFRIMTNFFNFSKIKLSLYTRLHIVFLIDVTVGTFSESSLSTIFSYLFWGTIVALAKSPRLHLMLGLFGANLILSVFEFSSVSIISPLASFFLTFIFTLIFPVILISMPFPTISGPIISNFLKLIDVFYNIANLTYISGPIFLLIIISVTPFFLTKNNLIKYLCIPFIIFSISSPLNTTINKTPGLSKTKYSKSYINNDKLNLIGF